MRHYKSIAEIREANRAGGFFFFSRDTLRFFRSVIYRGIYGGRYFVTSEQGPRGAPRRWTIRIAKETGSVGTVGNFQAYGSLDAARRAAKELAKS